MTYFQPIDSCGSPIGQMSPGLSFTPNKGQGQGITYFIPLRSLGLQNNFNINELPVTDSGFSHNIFLPYNYMCSPPFYIFCRQAPNQQPHHGVGLNLNVPLGRPENFGVMDQIWTRPLQTILPQGPNCGPIQRSNAFFTRPYYNSQFQVGHPQNDFINTPALEQLPVKRNNYYSSQSADYFSPNTDNILNNWIYQAQQFQSPVIPNDNHFTQKNGGNYNLDLGLISMLRQPQIPSQIEDTMSMNSQTETTNDVKPITRQELESNRNHRGDNNIDNNESYFWITRGPTVSIS